MKTFDPKTGLVLLTALGLLAGCGGSAAYAPSASDAAFAPTGIAQVPDANPSGFCTPPVSKLPGTYVQLVAFGNVKGKTFTSQSGTWLETSFATGPQPTPSTIPSAKPGPPDYVYYGTYVLKKNKQSGCAVLLVTQNGKPFKGSKQNAISVGSPLFKTKGLTITPTGVLGNLSVTIGNLSPSGGSGSGTLTTETGGAFDTAQITLTGRISETP